MKPILLLDVDGVLADFSSAYLDAFYAVTGVRKSLSDITKWEFRDHDWFAEAAEVNGMTVGQLNRRVGDIVSRPGFCLDIDPHRDAELLFESLTDLAEVYAVTSPWLSSPTWMSERTEWLKKHFGIRHTNVIHASTKHLVKGDVFVDDKVSNVLAWQGEWKDGIGVVFARSYNENCDLLVRGGWETVMHVLERKAREVAA